ncbi:hypothetical protein [Roseibium sp. RKSG952]|uniref:hypothetical protein n=1 Tax=Roseibium sp. RKSG952 TaxID=2529384 RepID=UPI0012BD3FA3|nr:hypothetical protein [Roseibium sp. RKSG952]MTH96981.1 hypothetical protein [Roseibium sp. RKSG952]
MYTQHLDVSRALQIYIAEVEKHGLTVIQSHDFDRFAWECGRQDEILGTQGTLSEPFSQDFFDFTPENALWIGVYDRNGDCVSGHGCRMDRLGRLSLRDYWMKQQHRIYVAPYASQKPELGRDHAPGTEVISGNCVYHGNMWLANDWKGTGVALPLCRIGQLVAHLKWDLDYIYCFIGRKLVSKGFAAHQGYAHIQPLGTHWLKAPSHIRADDYLCYNTPQDLDHLARDTIQSAEAVLSYKPKTKPQTVLEAAE